MTVQIMRQDICALAQLLRKCASEIYKIRHEVPNAARKQANSVRFCVHFLASNLLVY